VLPGLTPESWLSFLQGSDPVPIRPFLAGRRFDLETTSLMGIAFEIVRAAVRSAPRADLTDEIIAGTIIELAKTGERNVDVLCEAALSAPNPPLPASPPRKPGSSSLANPASVPKVHDWTGPICDLGHTSRASHRTRLRFIKREGSHGNEPHRTRV
jgi:hypothetical protein